MAIRLCINTQTPPVQPIGEAPADETVVWRYGHEYTASTGGVIPMTRSLLALGVGRWIARPATWIALGAQGLPKTVRTNEGYVLHTVELPPDDRSRYTRFKEEIWRSFHGPRGFRPSAADYPAFVRYSAQTALELLSHVRETDLYYVNDFQQVLTGGLIGTAGPALLRWHIPLDFRGYPEPVRRFFLKAMEGFDSIVVSTRSALEDLIGAGFQGRAYQQYPYLDPREHQRAKPKNVERLREEFQLGKGPVVLSVGRMDPVKRQDLAIDAVARLKRSFPDVKLLLVGGGSFTTYGLGSGKATTWRDRLEAHVHRLRLEGTVVFAGTLPQEMLRAAYGAADVFVHPAPWEGFGLVVVEAWTHGRPVVISRAAGAAELVEDGYNGLLTPPGSAVGIATRLETLLRHPEAAARMGEAGRHTAVRCHVEQAAPRLKEVFQRTIEYYGRSMRTRLPHGAS